MKDDNKIETNTEKTKNSRRDFIKKASVATTGVIAGTAAPFVYSKSNPIKWRLQT